MISVDVNMLFAHAVSQWRDHWMQAIYYPQTSVSVEKGEEFIVHANHDEYSLWFDVTKKGW